MWIIFAFLMWFWLLITLSLNLAPKVINKSHFVAAILDAFVPCIPIIPVYNSWSLGNSELAIKVVETGAFIFSANTTSSSVDPDIPIPPPA